MQVRHTDREQYFNENSITAEKYFIPLFKEFIDKKSDGDFRVLEVGCGEGGNLAPFAARECSVVGVEIVERRIGEAYSFFEKRGLKGHFLHSDIFDYRNDGEKFDLIILNNVIEHIDDKPKLFEFLENLLRKNGELFLVFPPWQMPFGGHQQVAKKRMVSHFPFLHLLPTPLYRGFVRMAGEPKERADELIDIKQTRVGSLRKLTRMAGKVGFEVVSKQYYFIAPGYEVKFGLKPRKLTPIISSIPWLRNFFCTNCFWRFKVAPAVRPRTPN